MRSAALSEGLGAGMAPVAEEEERDEEEVEEEEEAQPEAEGEQEPAAGEGNGTPAPVVGRAERFQVVVHVSAETARRLACDASTVTMVHDREGSVLDVGRKRRTVPVRLRRALDHRDGGCRFPGCASRFCDAHHVTPWAEGGETKLENLVLLCRHHHRRVHEDGWRVELVEAGQEGESGEGGTEVRFLRPDGRPLPRVPPTPAVPEDAAAALQHDQHHLGIDADTATPRWEGERMDVDWALFTLRGADGAELGPEAPVAAAQSNVSAETVSMRQA